MTKAKCISYSYEIILCHEKPLVLYHFVDMESALKRAMSVVCAIWNSGDSVKSVLIHENINGHFSRTVAFIQPKCDNVENLNI